MRDAATVSKARKRENAAALFRPMRLQILEELRGGGTAAGVARRLRVPRQKVSYHLKALEAQGLVELLEERRKGNVVERVVRATARSYLVGAEALGALSTDPAAVNDRFSSAYLVGAAARAIREVADLRDRAERAGKRVATFTLESDVRFASAERRHAFVEELTNAIARLVARYHDEAAPGGRRFHLIFGAYPAPPSQPGQGPRAPTRPRRSHDHHETDRIRARAAWHDRPRDRSNHRDRRAA